MGHEVLSIIGIFDKKFDWVGQGDNSSCSGCVFSRPKPGNSASVE